MSEPTLRERLKTVRRYRYQLTGAAEAGVHMHPQVDILCMAPDATDFQPVSIGDCWLFSAPTIDNAPAYVVDISGDIDPDLL